jgi:hypothetical protein
VNESVISEAKIFLSQKYIDVILLNLDPEQGRCSFARKGEAVASTYSSSNIEDTTLTLLDDLKYAKLVQPTGERTGASFT